MSTEDIFKEAEEDLRKERLQKLWDQYGLYAILGAIAIVAGVGGTKAWESYQTKQYGAIGAQFTDAASKLEDATDEKAVKVLNDLKDGGHSGYRTLAKLRLAGVKIKAGETDKAAELYDEISKSGSVEPLLQGFARLQAATLKLDKAEWSEMENRLTKLVDGESPWRHSAREILGLAALKAKKSSEAEKILNTALTDRALPPSMRRRIAILLDSATQMTAEDLAKKSADADANKDKSAAKKDGGETKSTN